MHWRQILDTWQYIMYVTRSGKMRTNRYIFCILTWAPQFVNATTPYPVSMVWCQAKRQTDKGTDRRIQGDRWGQTKEGQTERKTEGQREGGTERGTDRHRDGHTNWATNRQRDRQKDPGYPYLPVGFSMMVDIWEIHGKAIWKERKEEMLNSEPINSNKHVGLIQHVHVK